MESMDFKSLYQGSWGNEANMEKLKSLPSQQRIQHPGQGWGQTKGNLGRVAFPPLSLNLNPFPPLWLLHFYHSLYIYIYILWPFKKTKKIYIGLLILTNLGGERDDIHFKNYIFWIIVLVVLTFIIFEIIKSW